ncbi:MAG: hemolysin family protein [Actinomycetota bacterium]
MGALLLILITSFYVAGEFGLVAVDRDQVEAEARRGDRRARAAVGLLRQLSFHLSGAQLGITLSSLLLGFVAEPAIAEVLEPLLEPAVGERAVHGVSVALALAIATVAHMVVGELIPKNIAIARPLPTALALAGPTRVANAVARPLVHFLNGAANWTVRRLGIEPKEELTSVRSLEELELLIRSSGEEGTLDKMAFSLLTRSIRFGHKTAADALMPRVSVTTVAHDDSVASLLAAAARTGFSRVPVTGRDIDDIVGVAHVKDVLRLAPDDRPHARVEEIMREVFVVPETRDLGSILLEMRDAGHQLVVVVDEYGGTAGILTIEDLLEEIVGEIEDEYDPIQPSADLTLPSRDGVYDLEGTLHPDEVLEQTGFVMPEGDYETLAGFLLCLLGHIPEVGERARHNGWHFEVLELDRLRVARIRVTQPTHEPGDRDERDEPA